MMMNNVIKLRVWNDITKEMEYIDMYWFEEEMLRSTSEYDHLKFMMYSGTKDKKDNEIYDGDVLLLDILNSQESSMIDDTTKVEVFKKDLVKVSFENGAFGFSPVFPKHAHKFDRLWRPLFDVEEGELWTQHMKKVGNIYEGFDCPDCRGTRYDHSGGFADHMTPCYSCNGSGKFGN